MSANGKDPYAWIEKVVKAGQLIGLNPVRTRWKLRAWQDRMEARKRRTEIKAEAVTRRHKTCPNCRALNSAEDKICAQCGAKLHSMPVEMAERFLRRFDLGLSPETFLAAAFVIVYLIAAVTGKNSSFFSLSPIDLIRIGGNYVDPGGTGNPLAFNLFGHPGTLNGQWWRLWTCVFLHGGLIHLGFNTYAMIYIAPMVRTVFGRAKMLLAFTVTGILSSAVSTAWYFRSGHTAVSIGASGAIMGLIGLMLAWGHMDGTSSGINVRNNMARWVLYILLFGMFVGGIDNAGHIGGLISGAAIGLVLPAQFGRKPSTAWAFLGGLSIALILGAVVLIGVLAAVAPQLGH